MNTLTRLAAAILDDLYEFEDNLEYTYTDKAADIPKALAMALQTYLTCSDETICDDMNATDVDAVNAALFELEKARGDYDLTYIAPRLKFIDGKLLPPDAGGEK